MANATLSKDEILEAIGNMSVFELADLIEAFKSRFNVTIAAAPVGAVLVGEATYRQTANVIAFQAVDPLVAKGKTDPVTAHRVRFFA